jgi:hypothetical protein
MDSVDNRPCATTGVAYFSTPILAYFSAPIDTLTCISSMAQLEPGGKEGWSKGALKEMLTTCGEAYEESPWWTSRPAWTRNVIDG